MLTKLFSLSDLTFLAVTLVILCSLTQCQQYGQVEFRIKEQMPSGTNVGSIREKAKIVDRLSRTELSNLSFKFLNPNNLQHMASLFSINSDNGAIYTTAMIDRESVCQFQKTCNVEFEVTVTCRVSKFFEIVSVRIIIEDINDNTPRFPNEEITLYISESVNVNSEFRIAGATDKDTDEQNSVRKYEMKSEFSDMFELKSEMKLDGTWDLSIVILKPLDRERQDHFLLYIIAKDNGVPPRAGNVTVHINITDTNDNSPMFTENTYEVDVPEQAEVGAVVGQVRATDADSGMNAEINYKFSKARSSQLDDLFFIDSQSGEIKVKSELQYEAGKSFETIVVASDRGNPPRASQAVLILSILDIGNTPPRIAVNAVPNPDGNTLTISEASPVELVVAHIKTDDRDSGLNGIVDCSSVSPKFNVRRFEGSGFLVELAQQLDRETEEEVNVTIVCEDRGTPKLAAYGWFLIKLLDANDNHPVFTMQIYRANLTENNRKGDPVLTVRAYDRDLGDNSRVRYSFSVDGEEPSFIIDSITGEITAGQEFDRETVSQVSFVVMAEDGGKKVGKTSVIVDIIDQNDNSPYFISSLEFQVAEKLPAGSKVDTLEAKDRDDGQNAEVVFVMPDESVNSENPIPFVVIPNGIIRTANILDKDKKDSYRFPVIVKDKGNPPRSSSATVTIHVIDSNDHHPQFIFPSLVNYTVRFRSDTPPGSLITRLIATDKDVGRNARLKYSIVAGNHEKVFVITDPHSGEIRLTNDTEVLYGLQTGIFHLNVTVRDQGIPVLDSQALLVIHIDYVGGRGMGRTRSDDGSLASTLDEDDIKYIIIAGVIGSITVIISVIIVTIILLMRRPDRNARTSGVAGVQEQGDGRHFEKQIWQSVPIDDVTPTEMSGKSFGSVSHKEEHVGGDGVIDPKANNGGFGSNSNHDLFDPYTRKQCSEIFQGQPQLYTFKKCVLRPPSDDHQSDTSGETTTSDSGRGGSEEDIQLPPLPENCEDTSRIIFRSIGSGLKDSRFVQSDHPDSRDKDSIAFETFSPRTLPDGSGLQERLPAAVRDAHTLNPSDRHDRRWLNKKSHLSYDAPNCHNQPSYLSPGGKQQQHYHQQQQHSSPVSGPGQYPQNIPDRGESGLGSKKVTFQTDLTTQNLKTWDLCQKMSAQPSSMYLAPPGCHGSTTPHRVSYGSKSRNQDDDDNTTTSGSYTISPENDLDDILAVSFPAA